MKQAIIKPGYVFVIYILFGDVQSNVLIGFALEFHFTAPLESCGTKYKTQSFTVNILCKNKEQEGKLQSSVIPSSFSQSPSHKPWAKQRLWINPSCSPPSLTGHQLSPTCVFPLQSASFQVAETKQCSVSLCDTVRVGAVTTTLTRF